MVQPFVEFEKMYIPRLRALKKIYLVSQSFHRARNSFSENKINILVTAYDDLGTACVHRKAVEQDPYGAVINLTEKDHFEKFTGMLLPDSKYKVYWTVVADAARLEKQLNTKYADHMRRYIEKNCNWQIGGKEKIQAGFEVTFGELFVTFKWRSQRQRVKFEEIEKS